MVPSNRRLSKSYNAPVKVKPQETDFLRRMYTGVRIDLIRTTAFKIKLSNSAAINPEHLGFLRLQFNGINIGHEIDGLYKCIKARLWNGNNKVIAITKIQTANPFDGKPDFHVDIGHIDVSEHSACGKTLRNSQPNTRSLPRPGEDLTFVCKKLRLWQDDIQLIKFANRLEPELDSCIADHFLPSRIDCWPWQFMSSSQIGNRPARIAKDIFNDLIVIVRQASTGKQ